MAEPAEVGPRAARVRARVLAAARRAAAKRAPEPPSVADVARAARVSWPTANRHLGGKAGLAALLERPPVPADPTRTRDRLLAAAARVVAHQGVDGASLEVVSHEAGVTKGALYWHFDTKAELIAALLDERRTPAEDDWASVVDAALARPAVDAALEVELAAAAARDPTLREALARRRRGARAALAKPLAGGDPRRAAVMQALLDGLAMARRLDDARALSTLRQGLRALFARR